MVFKFSSEVFELRRHLPDTPDIKIHFNSPVPAMVQISKNYSDGKEPEDASSAVCVGTTTGEIEDEKCASEIQTALSTSLDGKWANFRGVDASRMPTVLA